MLQGYTCDEFQALPPELHSAEDAALMLLAKQGHWKRCPSCRHMVERLTGCNHMVCRCGNAFCYACGALYHAGPCQF